MTVIYIISAAAIVLVALLILIATRPDKLHVERTAQVNAPAIVVFDIINDLHQWSLWSPYDRHDPNMQKTYAGEPKGTGAIYMWNGNNHVGEGRLTIIDSKPDELVTMRLEFTRPFKCNNRVDFKLVPNPSGTRVSWIMEGKNNFMAKAMSLVMNMDKMCGNDFELGLENLNKVAQSKS